MNATQAAERERREREANDFVAELICTQSTPAQRIMMAAAAKRMGLLAHGEDPVYDGRFSSEVAHRLVAHAVATMERGGDLSRFGAPNRAQRRAQAAQQRRVMEATARDVQRLKRGAP